MKKIKSFKHFDDGIINHFIDISKGKIVNYNPIVIEYDDENLQQDPFKDYDVFRIPKDVTMTGSYAFNDEDLSTTNYMRYRADTICFPKKGNSSKIKLICEDKLILDNSDLTRYVTVSIENKKHSFFFNGIYFCFGGYHYYDYDHIDSFDGLYEKLEEMGCVKINYDVIFDK